MVRRQIVHHLLTNGASREAPYSVKAKLPHELALMQRTDPDAKLLAAALDPSCDEIALDALLEDEDEQASVGTPATKGKAARKRPSPTPAEGPSPKRHATVKVKREPKRSSSEEKSDDASPKSSAKKVKTEKATEGDKAPTPAKGKAQPKKEKARKAVPVDSLRHWLGFPKVLVWCGATEDSAEGTYPARVFPDKCDGKKIYVKYIGRWTGVAELVKFENIKPLDGLPAPPKPKEEDYYFRCICGEEGHNAGSGNIVQCDQCSVWCHANGICHDAPVDGEQFFCDQCEIKVQEEKAAMEAAEERPKGVEPEPEPDETTVSSGDGEGQGSDNAQQQDPAVPPPHRVRWPTALPAALWPHRPPCPEVQVGLLFGDDIDDEDDESDDESGEESGAVNEPPPRKDDFLPADVVASNLISVAVSSKTALPHSWLAKAAQCMPPRDLMRVVRASLMVEDTPSSPLMEEDCSLLEKQLEEGHLDAIRATMAASKPFVTAAKPLSLLRTATVVLCSGGDPEVANEVAGALCQAAVKSELPWEGLRGVFRPGKTEEYHAMVSLVEAVSDPFKRIILVDAALGVLCKRLQSTNMERGGLCFENVRESLTTRIDDHLPESCSGIIAKLQTHGIMALLMAGASGALPFSDKDREDMAEWIERREDLLPGLGRCSRALPVTHPAPAAASSPAPPAKPRVALVEVEEMRSSSPSRSITPEASCSPGPSVVVVLPPVVRTPPCDCEPGSHMQVQGAGEDGTEMDAASLQLIQQLMAADEADRKQQEDLDFQLAQSLSQQGEEGFFSTSAGFNAAAGAGSTTGGGAPASTTGGANGGGTAEEGHINIKLVWGHLANQEVHYRVKRTTALRNVMNAYCQHQGEDIASLQVP